MGSMLRSDLMTLCDVYLQPEAAFKILCALGDMGCVQFLDANSTVPPFQKQYVSELCRCAEMERKLRYIRSEMEKDGIKVIQATKEPPALPPNEMISVENLLEKWEEDIKELSANQVSLLKNYVTLSEMYYVLEQVEILLGSTDFTIEQVLSKSMTPRKVEEGELGRQLIVTTGTVARKRCFSFEMMLWRVSLGNVYFRISDKDKIIKDPQTGVQIRKVAFLAICQGEELNNRIQKVCNGYRANIYTCPHTQEERIEIVSKILYQTFDIEEVLQKTHYHRCKTLRVIAREWDTYMIQVKKAKAIYHTLNLFNLDITKNCLIGQCWVPDSDLQRVEQTLEKISASVGSNVPSFMSKTHTKTKPPTFHRTNKFTYGFQALINAYGDSTYREINPGLFTVVTFPFLFALMFGDVGHGIILVIFASWMCIKEKKYLGQKSDDEIWNIFFGGRYVILMLGLFSIYVGFIYNDIFSRSINLGGSYWRNHHTEDLMSAFEQLDLNPSYETARVYWFGIDPVWTLSSNQIMVENSIKMKFSIIIGICHMMLGLVLSLFDHLYFKRYYAIFLEFLPQILFLMCIFCWLVFLIYFKWFKYGAKEQDITLTPGCAPQILILFIDMCLFSETKPLHKDCEAYMIPYQTEIQIALVLLAALCVPVLLFGTPVYLFLRNKRKREICMHQMSNFRRYQHRKESAKQMEKIEARIKAQVAKYTTSFGELMIHQGVSTIEYVLSTISHTASYLRLWALSLAHAELSVMLWKMIFRIGLSDTSITGCLSIYVMFAIWAAFTMSILVVMEGMSAFLHTLRLHWVEFMSKFYLGRGWIFRPLSFAVILAAEDEKSDKICKWKAKEIEDRIR